MEGVAANGTIYQMCLCLLLKVGNLQTSYRSAKHSLEVFPEHVDSQELIRQLEHHFAAV